VTAAAVPAALGHRERTSLLGMVMFMAAWAMLFAGLFFAYGVLRVRSTAWPPADLPALPVGLPAAATALLALSSLTLERARRRGGSPAAVVVALAAGFLILQAVVWRSLILAGLHPPLGPYASVFFGLTAFHALHVVVGLGAFGWMALRRTAGALPLRLWALYWHMVGAIWAVMFVTVYVW
jgi:heme/copper-type cytochrome/quinol oxidase subunit 3